MCYFLFTFLNGSESAVNYHLLFNNILNKFLHSLQICSTLHVNVLSLKLRTPIGDEDSTGGVGGDGKLSFHKAGGTVTGHGCPCAESRRVTQEFNTFQAIFRLLSRFLGLAHWSLAP